MPDTYKTITEAVAELPEGWARLPQREQREYSVFLLHKHPNGLMAQAVTTVAMWPEWEWAVRGHGGAPLAVGRAHTVAEAIATADAKADEKGAR